MLAPVLHAYLDDELEPERVGIFVRHLEGCHRCRRDLAAYEALKQRIAADVSPAPGVIGRLREFANGLGG